MSLIIELSPAETARLRAAAERAGVEPAECARQVLDQHLPLLPAPTEPTAAKDPTIALFEEWEAEDGTDDPEEIVRRTTEWEELKAALNANRAATGERLLFPGSR